MKRKLTIINESCVTLQLNQSRSSVVTQAYRAETQLIYVISTRIIDVLTTLLHVTNIGGEIMKKRLNDFVILNIV